MKKYIIVIVGVFIFSACTKKEETQTPTEKEKSEIITNITLTEAQLKNLKIETVSLEEAKITSSIKLNARTVTSPQDLVSVTNVMGGFIKSIQVLPGSTVKKGQLIASIEDPSFVQLQEDYLTTKALLTKATAEYNRQKELNESQAASNKVLEEAKTELNLLQIKKRSIEEKLQLIKINPSSINVNSIKRSLNIMAPVSGTVNNVYVNRGQYIAGSEAIVDIIQAATPMLNIKAFENDLPSLQVGQQVEAYTNTDINEKITAVIVSIPQHVNEDGSIDILARINSTNNKRFTANMYFNVTLTHETTTSNTLPENAIVNYEGKDYIFEATKGNTFEMIPVKIGKSSDGRVEIKSNLSSDKKYVSEGAYSLLMALKNSQEEED